MASIGGVSYTKQACYVRALEIAPKIAAGWAHLGEAVPADGCIVISGISYTKRAIYIRVLEIDPSNAWAWAFWGLSLPSNNNSLSLLLPR